MILHLFHWYVLRVFDVSCPHCWDPKRWGRA
jgi:hypothetical protein